MDHVTGSWLRAILVMTGTCCCSLSADVLVEVSVSKQLVEPGGQFEFRCKVTNKKPDDLTQIIKTKTELFYDTQVETLLGIDGNPWEICNGTMMNPALQRATDRYRIIKGDHGTLIAQISDAQPGDSGYWACRVISDSNGDEPVTVYEITDNHALNITVVGPILDMGWYRGPHTDTLRPLGDGHTLQVTEESRDLLVCSVKYTNVQPTVTLEWVKGDERRPLEQHMDYNIITYSHMESSDSGLVETNLTSLYVKRGFFGSTLFNGYQLICNARLQFHREERRTVLMNIEYAPVVRCTPNLVAALVDTENIALVCTARGNPVPEVSWRTPSVRPEEVGGADLTIDTETDGDTVTSTYRIAKVLAAHYGRYVLTATNSFGKQEDSIKFLDEIPSTAGHSCYSLLVATLGMIISQYGH